MRILVAYDGSGYADRMLDDLRYAGLPEQADVLIVSVAERWLPRPEMDVATWQESFPSRDVVYGLAEKASKQLAAAFPSWSITCNALTGSPAREILRCAEEWKAGLIAVGSLGHSALERILIGSVSYKVANEAPCSVRVCRQRGTRRDGPVRIVLGYDGMPGSESAALAVARRHWPNGAAVRIVTSVGFGYSPVARMTILEDYNRAKQMQSQAESILSKTGFAVSSAVVEGDPKLTMIAEAEAMDADSIFIGHNDRGKAYRIFIGTVASAIVSRARCSVEIVRSPAES
jgi:nucleotide-binding universal stress UspA family protein